MNTYYIRCVAMYHDPIWGVEATTWLRSPIIRCTRNTVRKAVFEWVGNSKAPVDLVALRKQYGLIEQVA